MPLPSIAMNPSTRSSATVFGPIEVGSIWALAAGATAKVTTSAPEPFRKSRRERLSRNMAGPSSRHHLGRTLHRAHDPRVGAAAAEVVRERLPDLLLGRPLVGVEQRLRLHHHAVDAVAALH